MSDHFLTTRIERSDGSLVVNLSGEIDLSNSQRLQQQLERVVEGWPRVVIHLTEVSYLDSQALRLIKQLHNKSARDRIKLRLVAPPDSFARQVLEMARLSDYIEISDTFAGWGGELPL
jgi:anti-anti-sigma factor